MAAGSTDSAEELGEARVSEKIFAACRGVGPIWVLQQRLAPQLVRDAKAFARSESSDALCPVAILGRARRVPISCDELADPALDHGTILP